MGIENLLFGDIWKGVLIGGTAWSGVAFFDLDKLMKLQVPIADHLTKYDIVLLPICLVLGAGVGGLYSFRRM